MAKRSSTTYERNKARIKTRVARGDSVREIAEDLDCSTSTASRCKRKAKAELRKFSDE